MSSQFKLGPPVNRKRNVAFYCRPTPVHWLGLCVGSTVSLSLINSNKMSVQEEAAMDGVFLSACIDGDVEKVRRMLQLGFTANSQDNRGRSCLHLAAGRGHEEVLLELLCAGADVNVVDFQGNTPLHYCSHTSVVKLLMQYGADVHSRNNLGVVPVEALKRRKVDGIVVNYLEHITSLEASYSSDDITEPFLPKTIKKKPSHQVWGHLGSARTLWMEFCQDLGTEKLIIVILLCLLFSLYVAYVMTGLAQEFDAPIALNDNMLSSSF